MVSAEILYQEGAHFRMVKAAIRKAAKWTVVSQTKLPSVAAFIADVRLAIGSGVLERRRLLAQFTRSPV